MPASNDVRVRVDGASKMSATERRTSTSELQRRSLELGGAVQQSAEFLGAELGPGEEVAWHGPQCTLGRVQLRVLTWNLMHGRSVPSARRDLLDEFGAALHGWEWDVALLQEVPPWWTAAAGQAPARRAPPGAHLAQRPAAGAASARAPLA